LNPIQQETGHAIIHDSKYQWGKLPLQLTIVTVTPIASPIAASHNTCRPGRSGANRAHTHAQKMLTSAKHAVLIISVLFDGARPFTNSPGNIRDNSGSVANTSTTDSK
jgi:hypothetical protein